MVSLETGRVVEEVETSERTKVKDFSEQAESGGGADTGNGIEQILAAFESRDLWVEKGDVLLKGGFDGGRSHTCLPSVVSLLVDDIQIVQQTYHLLKLVPGRVGWQPGGQGLTVTEVKQEHDIQNIRFVATAGSIGPDSPGLTP